MATATPNTPAPIAANDQPGTDLLAHSKELESIVKTISDAESKYRNAERVAFAEYISVVGPQLDRAHEIYAKNGAGGAFQKFCIARFSYVPRTCRRLRASWRVTKLVTGAELLPPATESACREVSSMDDKKLISVWRKASESSDGLGVTASDVADVLPARKRKTNPVKKKLAKDKLQAIADKAGISIEQCELVLQEAKQ